MQEAAQNIDQRRFTRPALSDNSNFHGACHFQAHFCQRRYSIRFILDAYLLKLQHTVRLPAERP
ncbi:hypothetical protein D3C74_456460 [compost metagenome]